MGNVLQRIRAELRENSDPAIRESSKRYFREEIKVYGMKTAAVTRISKRYFQETKSLGKAEIFSLCEELFQSGYMEESFIACNWSYAVRSRFEEKDFATFERWVSRYISNWASCDTLCNHTVGAFIEKFPKYADSLKRWAKSKNRWMRRASAVSFIVPAKKGQFLKEALEISDILLEDKDDLVQKGYGWLLKEESKTRQAEVFKYIMNNKNRMPRTALRYAIEKMPKNLKTEAMKKGTRKGEKMNKDECCPKFNPEPWDGKTLNWKNKKFIKGKVLTFFFMPLNFGSVITKLMAKIEKAGATVPGGLCLSEDTSKFNMDIYLAVDKEIPDAENTTLSGKFLTKVYEGPYQDTGKWCKDFESYAKGKGFKIKKWYMWYTTCPKCAKKYGKNYVVIVSEVA